MVLKLINNIKPKHKHRVITLGYAVAVTLAFVLSLANNTNVNASVSYQDKTDYLMLENAISENVEDTNSVYPAERIVNIRSLFDAHNCLVVEELQADINQEALFHLYNLYRDEGGNILFLSEQAPARINFTLPDLRSRMNIVPTAEIKEPDDELLSALLVKLFNDRQITPSPELITYLLNNMRRSFAYARKVVAEIDTISLARKRAVTASIAKEALAALDNNTQRDLFSD